MKYRQIIKCFYFVLIIALFFTNLSSAGTSYEDYERYYHYLQALIYQRYGNILMAQKEYEKTIQLDPNAYAAYRELILIYTQTGRINDAISIAEEIRKKDNSVQTQLFLGGLYTLLGDTTTAVNVYENVLTKEPENTEATVLLAGIYATINPEKSLDYWDKFISFNKDLSDGYYQKSLVLLKLKRVADAKDNLQKAIDKDRENILPRLAIAEIYELENDYLKSIQQYEECLQFDPDNLSLLSHIGALYHLAKEYDRAEKVFLKIKETSSDPNIKGSMNFWLSLIYEERKDWKNAIKYIESAIEEEPAVSKYIKLSYYWTQSGNMKKALKVLDKSAKIGGDDPETYFFLGLGYTDIKEYKKAEKNFLKTLSIKDDFTDAHFYLGIIYEQTKRFEKSIPHLRRVLELNPKNDVALNYLGYSFADRGMNLDEAEQLIKRALEISPENGAYIDSLGWIYYKKGRVIEAKKELEKAIGKLEDPVIYEHLGDVEKNLGKDDNALKYYKKAQELDRKNRTLKKKIKEIQKGLK